MVSSPKFRARFIVYRTSPRPCPALPAVFSHRLAAERRADFPRPEPCMKHPRQTRRALFAALGLIPVVAVAAWQFIPPGRDQLATVQVSRADIESSVTALGTLQPRRYVDVGAQASGQIHKIHVEVGDAVKEGQLLVEIDPSTQKA